MNYSKEKIETMLAGSEDNDSLQAIRRFSQDWLELHARAEAAEKRVADAKRERNRLILQTHMTL